MKRNTTIAALMSFLTSVGIVNAAPTAVMRPVAFVNYTMTKAQALVLGSNVSLPVMVASQITSLKYGFILEVQDNGTPMNVDQLVITSVSFSHVRYDTSMSAPVVSPANISLMGSKFNPPGDGSKPDIQAFDVSGNLRSTIGNSLGNTTLTNVSAIYLTDHTVTLGAGPFPALKTQYCAESRSMLYSVGGHFTVGNVTTNFSFSNQAASVQIIADPLTQLETANYTTGVGTLIVEGDVSGLGYTLEGTAALDVQNWVGYSYTISQAQVGVPNSQRLTFNIGTTPMSKSFWRLRFSLVDPTPATPAAMTSAVIAKAKLPTKGKAMASLRR